MDKILLRQDLLSQRLAMKNKLYLDKCLQNVLINWLNQYRELHNKSKCSIGAYWAIKGEFNVLPCLSLWCKSQIVHDSTSASPICQISLPIIDPASHRLLFRTWSESSIMQRGDYGIPIPRDGEFITPTVLLIPCVGYNANGYRLGYGGGFYDRTLANFTTMPICIGLGYTQSFAPDFIPDLHDQPLDIILNENGVFYSKDMVNKRFFKPY